MSGALFSDLAVSIPSGLADAFRRPERLSVTEWAEKHVRLPPAVTSTPGPYRVGLTPFCRDPMDTWARPWVRRVVKCWAPQTSKTLSAYLPLLYAMDRAPGPALLTMSGQDGAKKVSRDYLQPILLESPRLRRLLPDNPDDVASYWLRLRNGMRVYLAWATSPALLKTFPARYGLGDEVDDWPASSGERGGDPESLFDVRLRTYPHTSKLELVSSPSEARGIWSKLVACQVVKVFLAKCQACGAEQRLVFGRIRGAPGAEAVRDPSTIEADRLARYYCAGCGAPWDNPQRDRAVSAGRWAAVAPEAFEPERWDEPFPPLLEHEPARPVSVGYHLPGWASRFVCLSKVSAEFLRANQKQDPTERVQSLRAWTNNYPAHPWIEAPAVDLTEQALFALRDERPAGVAPSWALCLVLTADVQESGVWYELRAWGENRTSALVRYGYLAGGVAGAGDLEALEALAAEEYPTTDGELLAVRLGLVDARYRGAEVYQACKRARALVPCLGYETRKAPVGFSKVEVIPGTSRAIPGGLLRVEIDTNHFKGELAARLKVARGDPGGWVLHAETGADYAQQYRAEYKDEATGMWKQRGRQANHLWDCGVYQLAAATVLEQQGVFARLARAARQAEEQARPAGASFGGTTPRPPEQTRLW